ncbi:hypothetical protein ACRAWD_24690 [Caulobacter segnis]
MIGAPQARSGWSASYPAQRQSDRHGGSSTTSWPRMRPNARHAHAQEPSRLGEEPTGHSGRLQRHPQRLRDVADPRGLGRGDAPCSSPRRPPRVPVRR